jgi:hypothetical protein
VMWCPGDDEETTVEEKLGGGSARALGEGENERGRYG